ncbi:MAG TPA: hypothetical protein VEI74_05325 [Candidatus Methylomirabilis sp.]|nr:hypothetical protein [Candidatus Methylomirabilis sp.]
MPRRRSSPIPLWVHFLAVQFLDVLWARLFYVGIERTRIVPGITASNPFNLYYMPYTHSLTAAIVGSCVGGLLYQIVTHPARRQTSVIIGLAAFSHWILDLIVHRPDLPLYDNTAKVGLELWNAPVPAFSLEGALLFGGIWLCLRGQLARSYRTLVFGVLMLGIQAYVFFSPPPTSDRAFASTAIIAYVAFALAIWWLQDRREITVAKKSAFEVDQNESGAMGVPTGDQGVRVMDKQSYVSIAITLTP